MANRIQICNMALGHLGEIGSISSIDPPEGSKYAEDCAQFYPMARDLAFAEAPRGFHFNTTRAPLALSGTPPSSWEYSYTWPADVLHPLAVLFPEYVTDEMRSQPFVTETTGTKRYIYTDVEQAVLRYTFKQTDEATWSDAFAMAVSYRLAALLAGPIIKGSKGIDVSQGMLRLFQDALQLAMAQDGNAQYSDEYRNFVSAGEMARR